MITGAVRAMLVSEPALRGYNASLRTYSVMRERERHKLHNIIMMRARAARLRIFSTCAHARVITMRTHGAGVKGNAQ